MDMHTHADTQTDRYTDTMHRYIHTLADTQRQTHTHIDIMTHMHTHTCAYILVYQQIQTNQRSVKLKYI